MNGTEKEQLKVEVSIVGPCCPEYGSFGTDSSTKELCIDVEVKSDHALREVVARYRLEMRSTRYSSGWSAPYIFWGAETVGRLQSLADAKATVAFLTRYQRYVASLPVHPEGPHEYVACILKLHKVKQARVLGYRDHTTPPDLNEDAAFLGRVTMLVYERWQALLRETVNAEKVEA